MVRQRYALLPRGRGQGDPGRPARSTCPASTTQITAELHPLHRRRGVHPLPQPRLPAGGALREQRRSSREAMANHDSDKMAEGLKDAGWATDSSYVETPEVDHGAPTASTRFDGMSLEDFKDPARERATRSSPPRTASSACPYVWGGSTPGKALGLQRAHAVLLPRRRASRISHYTEAQYERAAGSIPLSEAKPGDILYRTGHVGHLHRRRQVHPRAASGDVCSIASGIGELHLRPDDRVDKEQDEWTRKSQGSWPHVARRRCSSLHRGGLRALRHSPAGAAQDQPPRSRAQPAGCRQAERQPGKAVSGTEAWNTARTASRTPDAPRCAIVEGAMAGAQAMHLRWYSRRGPTDGRRRARRSPSDVTRTCDKAEAPSHHPGLHTQTRERSRALACDAFALSQSVPTSPKAPRRRALRHGNRRQPHRARRAQTRPTIAYAIAP